ncbi:hypothetical protein C8Q72DRAFT_948843, partial [Fomitopsis betulina]
MARSSYSFVALICSHRVAIGTSARPPLARHGKGQAPQRRLHQLEPRRNCKSRMCRGTWKFNATQLGYPQDL